MFLSSASRTASVQTGRGDDSGGLTRGGGGIPRRSWGVRSAARGLPHACGASRYRSLAAGSERIHAKACRRRPGRHPGQPGLRRVTVPDRDSHRSLPSPARIVAGLSARDCSVASACPRSVTGWTANLEFCDFRDPARAGRTLATSGGRGVRRDVRNRRNGAHPAGSGLRETARPEGQRFDAFAHLPSSPYPISLSLR